MQKLIQVRKVSFKKCHPSKLDDHFILFLLFWKKKISIKLETLYKQHNDNINGSHQKKKNSLLLEDHTKKIKI